MIIILSIYNAIVTPQQFALQTIYKDFYLIQVTDVVIDVIFALDVLIMFKTSYRDPRRDVIISNWKLIAINYIKGRFFVDFLASFPFDLLLPKLLMA